jgi:hypothetical protein
MDFRIYDCKHLTELSFTFCMQDPNLIERFWEFNLFWSVIIFLRDIDSKFLSWVEQKRHPRNAEDWWVLWRRYQFTGPVSSWNMVARLFLGVTLARRMMKIHVSEFLCLSWLCANSSMSKPFGCLSCHCMLSRCNSQGHHQWHMPVVYKQWAFDT